MLTSKYYDLFDKDKPLSEYPRMLLCRDSFINLNGLWDFCIVNDDSFPTIFDKTIVVPYAPESTLSGLNIHIAKGSHLFYKKIFNLPLSFIKDLVIINFLAVDQICNVYINRNKVFSHYNGYLPFSVDITKYINEGDNELIVEVIDNQDTNYPYGKQKDKRGGMWYTKVSGIIGTVFIESVSNDYIKDITIKTNLDDGNVNIILNSMATNYQVEVYLNNNLIYKNLFDVPFISFKIDDVKPWNIDNPVLYDLVIKTPNDKINSYFAFRKFEIKNNLFYLNNEPIFINGLLDQGYFVDGILTPCSYKEYEDDIKLAKEMGFNTLRKHIKIESPYFYYLADKLGILIFQDIVNSGKYNFFIDTILPTIGLKNIGFIKNASIDRKKIFKESLTGIVNNLYNNPSVVYYTIFNEGWGQHDEKEYYKLIKTIDNSRVVDTASGWFKTTFTDVDSLHIYFKKLNMKKKDKPTIISEFGGYSYRINNHCFSEHEYGYRKYNNENDYYAAIKDLYLNEVIDCINKGLAGIIYTQLSDVEDETNGFITYDRKVIKIEPSKLKEINDKIKEHYNGKL